MDAITFTAAVWKVQTLADGGIRITLDLAGNDANMIAMTELAACQIHGVVLDVEGTPQDGGSDREKHKKPYI